MMQVRVDESIELLKLAEEQFAPDLLFACSFGAEDVVLIRFDQVNMLRPLGLSRWIPAVCHNLPMM